METEEVNDKESVERKKNNTDEQAQKDEEIGKENTDPNIGAGSLKLKLRENASTTGNTKPRARQRLTTDTPKRKRRPKAEEHNDNTRQTLLKKNQERSGAKIMNPFGIFGGKERGAAEAMLLMSKSTTAARSEETGGKYESTSVEYKRRCHERPRSGHLVNSCRPDLMI